MSECPLLSKIPEDSAVIPLDMIDELNVSTYDRTVGTKVTVSCVSGYYLIGPSEVTCQSSLQWSGNPYCHDTPYGRVVNVGSNSGQMGEDKTALIVGSTVASVIFIALIAFLIAMLYIYKRKEKLIARKEINRYYNSDYYKDDGSFKAYSISGREPTHDQYQMYSMQHSMQPMDTPMTPRSDYPVSVQERTREVRGKAMMNEQEDRHCNYCNNNHFLKRDASVCQNCGHPRVNGQDLYRQVNAEHHSYFDRDNTKPVVYRDLVRDGYSAGEYILIPYREGYERKEIHDPDWHIPRPYYNI